MDDYVLPVSLQPYITKPSKNSTMSHSLVYLGLRAGKYLCLFLLCFVFFSCRAQRSPNTPVRQFDPKALDSIDHRISPDFASQLLRTYRGNRNDWSRKNMPLSEAFNRRQVLELLNQENCVGIRCSYGIDDKGRVRVILFGIDAQGRDIGALDGGVIDKQRGSTSARAEAVILESGQRCPEVCP